MPDTCYSPKPVAYIHERINATSMYFASTYDLEFNTAEEMLDVDVALLAKIGEDIVKHIRAGGSVILTEPPATKMDEGESDA